MPVGPRISLSAVLRRFRALGANAAVALALLASLGLASPSLVEFDAQHAEAAARNPSDLHLTLAPAGARTEFRPGEGIQVEYSLSSDTPEKYKSGDLWFDGSDRSRFEAFTCDRPADCPDPLAGHWTIWEILYNAHYTGRRGSWKMLGQAPTTERWDLNEYLRFDQPGKYRVYATTRHVLADWSAGRDAYAGGPPLTSGILELEILPTDVAWADDQLQHAVEALVLARRNEGLRMSAAKTIRYLQTPAALDAMVTHYTGANSDVDRQMLAGMIGYHDRAAAVKRMDQQLVAPDFGVSRWFLFSLGVMKLRLASPELSADELSKADKPTQKRWRHALFDVLLPYFSQLSSAAGAKTPRARALTVDTLFTSLATARFDFEPFPVSADQIESLRVRELAILPDLPPYEQLDRIANFGWAKTLPPEQVLPVLRKIYAHPSSELSGDVRNARKYVLKDVAAISPEESDKLLAEAVAEPNARLTVKDVSGLPMTPAPELDALLIGKLEGRRTEEMKSAAPLVGKYATPAILERVRAVYEVEKESWPCDIEAGLVAFFLRVDESYGVRALAPALAYAASRPRLTCQRPTLVGAISELYYSPPIEKAAIAQLDDPSPIATSDAIQVLRTHATEPGLAALLDRFRRFHEEWKDYNPQQPDPVRRQKWDSRNEGSLELSLVRALSQSSEYRRHADRLE
jgi:DNA-directed RNA polymerase subunit F